MPGIPVTRPALPYVRSNGLAQLLGLQGQHAADAEMRRGELAAQMWTGLGQNIASGLTGFAKAREEAPIRAAQLVAAQQQNDLGAQQLAAAKRQASDVATLDQAGATAPMDRAAFLAQVPGHLRPDIEKKYAEVDKLALDAKAAKQKAAEAEADYFGTLAAHVKPYLAGEDGGQGAVQLALQHAKEQGYDTREIEQHLQANPASLPMVLDSMIQASPTQRKLMGEEADRALRTKQEDRAIRAQEQAQADRLADNQRQDAAQAETIRHNRATEATAAANKNDVTDLSAAGLDMAALNYRKTGQMPALGNGDKTTRKRIIDRAAALTPDDVARIEAGGVDVAANRAEYGATSDTLKKLNAQRASIGAFEQTAQKNIDIFLDQARKITDTGSPLLNTPVRLITGKVLGAPDQAAYDAARQVAVNEIAKITSNPTLSGTLSDSARHEVESFNPQNATLKQTIAVMKLLKRDMANRAQSLDDAIAQQRGTLRGAAASASGKIRARDPQGNIHEAPVGTPLPEGWVTVP